MPLSRLHPLRLSYAAVAAAACFVAAASLADEARVVARVGSETISASAVEARIRRMPTYQLSREGTDPAAIARRVLDEMVEASLLSQGAHEEGLAEQPGERDRILAILASALLHEVREKAATEAVTDAEVRAFYDQHRERYASQERLKIAQLTVLSRDEAAAILATIQNDADYRKDPVQGWDKLVREHSIDGTTSMRGGDLGFVQPDGTTANKDLRVPPAIYQAAQKVGDGEVVPAPIRVGEHWLVIQRRGSVVTPERPYESEAPTIRSLLAREKLESLTKELVERLRKEHVKELHLELVDRIAVDAEGDLSPVPRPNSLRQSQKAAGPPRPEGSPGNLR
jgi:peptidyl-prolyl cis-trans isomerase C